ncbi:small, acid-soluble spore protein, H family [Ammoniphilus oxalaticus]|uniref:Small, acid-soluble spore protein, H family n=1 Tax=Ammoniphilus oxalaticus TaxID=66863 RepID=A0A419SKH1_9BACL|nr:H-type small acid-soluble spore protein [Ammoniphilus oxalaticus]RKD24450.1 small, acid-soluble spore protein, H family [Ammoniphilus oxalaticus]
MDKQRAMEIVSSEVMAHVTHEGKPVYIREVDGQAQTASVYPLGEPEKEQEVPLSSLIEQ